MYLLFLYFYFIKKAFFVNPHTITSTDAKGAKIRSMCLFGVGVNVRCLQNFFNNANLRTVHFILKIKTKGGKND